MKTIPHNVVPQIKAAPERGVFCNRTLNLKGIKAIGYDMDYTLVHYRVIDWERRAYHYLQEKLVGLGWPVQQLVFDPELMIIGLIIDLELGNIVKANRFGYVKQAYHGTRTLSYEEQRTVYSRVKIDLSDDRFQFMVTLFSLSEVCMYAQLVDLLDKQKLPTAIGYGDLYRIVRRSLDEAHMEGRLKEEIISSPERFIDLDEETPLALLDQRQAGKKLMLITNSEWSYTQSIMRYVFDPFLPQGMTWKDLFDLVIVSARKPDFFNTRSPIFQVVDDQGLLLPVPAGLKSDGIYLGGNAMMLEHYLGCSKDEILYVGDHIFSDVHMSNTVRWRTALILRELEGEIAALTAFERDQQQLTTGMVEKERLERYNCQLQLHLQRKRKQYGPQINTDAALLERELKETRDAIAHYDEQIAPLAKASGEINNRHWGLLMRAGNDKSYLARQLERYADVYTSRVSNFLHLSPFAYLRSPRGSLPHDPLRAYLDDSHE